MNLIDELQAIFGQRLLLNEPMMKHTNMRVGGPARIFIEAKTGDEIRDAIFLAQKYGAPYFVLGGGTNLLVSDVGFNGLVVKNASRGFIIEGEKVIADSGAIMSAVARATARAGLAGLEWAVSLPGSVGGAVRGNAGCFGGETKDNLQSVEILRVGNGIATRAGAGAGAVDTGAPASQSVSASELEMNYRHSKIKNTDDIILSAVFALKKGNATELQKALDENLAKRLKSQPQNASSAGCVFKNPVVDGERVSAGKLIDQAGLKGYTIGKAKISEDHGNFFLNTGGATASEMMELVNYAKMKVMDMFGVKLEEEIKLLGF